MLLVYDGNPNELDQFIGTKNIVQNNNFELRNAPKSISIYKTFNGTVIYKHEIYHKLRKFVMGFQPINHGLLSDGSTKFSSNISFDMFPPVRNPTSFATISALSCTWIGS